MEIESSKQLLPGIITECQHVLVTQDSVRREEDRVLPTLNSLTGIIDHNILKPRVKGRPVNNVNISFPNNYVCNAKNVYTGVVAENVVTDRQMDRQTHSRTKY